MQGPLARTQRPLWESLNLLRDPRILSRTFNPLDRPLKSLCDVFIPIVHDDVINKDSLFSIYYKGSLRSSKMFSGTSKALLSILKLFQGTLWYLGAPQVSSQGPWNESWTLERNPGNKMSPSVRWTSSEFSFKDSRWDGGGVPWRTLYLTICSSSISTILYVVVAVIFAVLNCSICGSRRCHGKNFGRSNHQTQTMIIMSHFMTGLHQQSDIN